jgi:hypothetical protein
LATDLGPTNEHIQKWTLRLCEEHRQISYQYNLKLKCPLIEIIDYQSLWGSWDPLTRTIRLSLRLLWDHDWHTVVQVFKHEMAHQIVSELMGGEADHGADFQLACEMIDLQGDFCKAKGDISRPIEHWREEFRRNQNSKLMVKVEKLLALAESSNENEAALAMQRVRDIYHRHNLQQMEKKSEQDFAYTVVTHKKKRFENYQSLAASLITSYFFVNVVFSEEYDTRKCTSYKTLEILGRKENVLMAEYVYYFLLNQLDILWKLHKQNHPSSARLKRSFFLGALNGFEQKLKDQELTMTIEKNDIHLSTSKQLIVSEQKRLRQYVKKRFPKMSVRGYGQGRVDGDTFAQGKEQGRRLNLRRGVTENKGFGGLLQMGPR